LLRLEEVATPTLSVVSDSSAVELENAWIMNAGAGGLARTAEDAGAFIKSSFGQIAMSRVSMIDVNVQAGHGAVELRDSFVADSISIMTDANIYVQNVFSARLAKLLVQGGSEPVSLLNVTIPSNPNPLSVIDLRSTTGDIRAELRGFRGYFDVETTRGIVKRLQLAASKWLVQAPPRRFSGYASVSEVERERGDWAQNLTMSSVA
ncbi:hypothetical protein HK101_005412, partial [Irineochytrium annulatum]